MAGEVDGFGAKPVRHSITVASAKALRFGYVVELASIATRDPYHTHVRDISSADHQWPHLRWLADFMNIGTVTARWQEKAAENESGSIAERMLRTNVCLLEYCRDQKPPQCTLYKTRDSLKAGLAGLKPDQILTLHLFVVEDLSRTVIEALGYKFGVEPDFFREHLYAYAWNNPRDPWKDAATLEVDLE
ncbi:predicted protein [Verticillium alfalfae VaMs.102]|uniref:Predicted protein n=1 Tax=Verticillium alfalfae (strain VaMs.102 / ATCC MYA-4576 / FGSC 10136) TaxID=526221 RepID=C9SRV5_VERA1|nr:predicted protein [Verticillium alfalfae VaMs.102]EEY21520.1 predicted protein [Verticillium alfalfae VaMs.102]